jgi:hypothetical protein
MIYADEYYHIGAVHRGKGKPCQDHALSYVDEEMAFGSISDGCSQGENTDVGARVINYATLRALKKCLSDEQSDAVGIADRTHSMRLEFVKNVQQELGLKNTDLIATNLYACVFRETAFVHVMGDGIVAVVDRQGNMYVRRFVWIDNAPYYPFYDLNQRDQFVAFHGNDLLSGRFTEEIWIIDCEGVKNHIGTISHPLIAGMDGIAIDLSKDLKGDELSFVAVFSDGAEQVDGMNWLDAVEKCLAYKNTAGFFVKRRMMRFIKDASKASKGPLDDMSCAAIHIPKNF